MREHARHVWGVFAPLPIVTLGAHGVVGFEFAMWQPVQETLDLTARARSECVPHQGPASLARFADVSGGAGYEAL